MGEDVAAIRRASRPAQISTRRLPRISQPTLIVRATAGERAERGGFAASPTVPDLATHFAQGRGMLDREHTHFLPMESPMRTAEYIRTMLGDGGDN
jgi:hypothetical protein